MPVFQTSYGHNHPSSQFLSGLHMSDPALVCTPQQTVPHVLQETPDAPALRNHRRPCHQCSRRISVAHTCHNTSQSLLSGVLSLLLSRHHQHVLGPCDPSFVQLVCTPPRKHSTHQRSLFDPRFHVCRPTSKRHRHVPMYQCCSERAQATTQAQHCVPGFERPTHTSSLNATDNRSHSLEFDPAHFFLHARISGPQLPREQA